MRLIRLAAPLMATLLVPLLGGCNTVPQTEYDAAIEENTNLRDRIATLQTNLEQARQANEAYEDQNAELRQENMTLAQRAAREATPRTGFEGIEGVETGRRAAGEVVVNVASDILFNSGSAQLRKEAKQTLDGVAGVLQSRYASNTIRVEGYTDVDPLVKTKDKWGTNENLSAARALAVETYLVNKGIDNNMIYSAAFGPSDPKGSKKASRRVEIVILGS